MADSDDEPIPPRKPKVEDSDEEVIQITKSGSKRVIVAADASSDDDAPIKFNRPSIELMAPRKTDNDERAMEFVTYRMAEIEREKQAAAEIEREKQAAAMSTAITPSNKAEDEDNLRRMLEKLGALERQQRAYSDKRKGEPPSLVIKANGELNKSQKIMQEDRLRRDKIRQQRHATEDEAHQMVCADWARTKQAIERIRKSMALKAQLAAKDPTLVAEFNILTKRFFRGDGPNSTCLPTQDELNQHMLDVMSILETLRDDPTNARIEGVFFSQVHISMAYVFLNQHKYPSFYFYLHKTKPMWIKLIGKRLCRYFRGADKAGMPESLLVYNDYASMVINVTECENDKEMTLDKLIEAVYHTIWCYMWLVRRRFKIVFYPEITLETARAFIEERAFPILEKHDGVKNLADDDDAVDDWLPVRRFRLAYAIIAYVKELYFEPESDAIDEKKLKILSRLAQFMESIRIVKANALNARFRDVKNRNVL